MYQVVFMLFNFLTFTPTDYKIFIDVVDSKTVSIHFFLKEDAKLQQTSLPNRLSNLTK